MFSPNLESFKQYFDTIKSDPVRDKAFSHFIDQGFPTRKVENWKYSNPQKILGKEYKLTHTNSSHHHELYGKLVSAHHPFANLNIACNQNTNTITLSKNTEMLALAKHLKGNEFSMDHVLIIVEDNIKASIDLRFMSDDESACLHNQVIEIYLKDGAELSLYNQQTLNSESSLTQLIAVKQEANSQFYSFTLDNGSLFTRHDIDICLAGKGAISGICGYYEACNKQHIDNHSIITHAATHCQSTQHFKGIMKNQSRAVFNAKAVINKGADKAQVTQINNNLLLSKHAEIDTKPELEIYAHDVKAAHGATVGQLNQEALFYLKARGLNHQQAIRLLKAGFVKEVFETIPNKEIAHDLLKSLNYEGDE